MPESSSERTPTWRRYEGVRPIAYFVRKDKERRQRTREFLQAQKVGKACRNCGNTDFRVLDFHHLDPTIKEGGLSHAVSSNWSKQRIAQEIAKCELLCANCHRILHWEERNGDTADGVPVPGSTIGG